VAISWSIWSSSPPKLLVGLAFLQDLPVRFARMLVGRLGVVHLGGSDKTLLLRPALIDALEAPFGAAAAGADGLPADQDEDRIRVRRRQDSQRHPTAAVDLHVE